MPKVWQQRVGSVLISSYYNRKVKVWSVEVHDTDSSQHNYGSAERRERADALLDAVERASPSR